MRDYKIVFKKKDVKKMDDLFSYFRDKLTFRFLQRVEIIIYYNVYEEIYEVRIMSLYLNVIKTFDKYFKEFLKEGGNSNDK